MGSPTIYYYPEGGGTFQAITLGTAMNDVQLQPMRSVVDAIGGDIRMNRMDLGGWREVRLIKERISDAAVVRALLNLETHLQRGHPIAFALDADKCWTSWCNVNPAAGDLTLATKGQCLPYVSGVALANGDNLTIESPNPELMREWLVVSSITGSKITVSSAVLKTYQVGPVMVRHCTPLGTADTYPALFMSSDQVNQPIITEDHRRNWTLDITLVEYPGALSALAKTAQSLRSASIGRAQGGMSLSEAVGGAAYYRPWADTGWTRTTRRGW